MGPFAYLHGTLEGYELVDVRTTPIDNKGSTLKSSLLELYRPKGVHKMPFGNMTESTKGIGEVTVFQNGTWKGSYSHSHKVCVEEVPAKGAMPGQQPNETCYSQRIVKRSAKNYYPDDGSG
jgi:hypothetical protein